MLCQVSGYGFLVAGEWNRADSANGGIPWEGEKKMLLGKASSKNSLYLCTCISTCAVLMQ